MSQPANPLADGKSWSWVVERRCPECGFDPGTVSREDLPELILGAAERFEVAVGRDGADHRPTADVWSPIEYSMHVADVLEVMAQRVDLIRESDGAGVEFDDWDQDAAAVEKEYWLANAHATAILIRERAESAAQRWAELEPPAWEWVGHRSDGATFTAHGLGLYLAHEMIHHLHDIDG